MRLYREPDLRNRDGYSNQHRRRLEAEGKFPKRFKLVEDSGQQGHIGWDADEVDEHYRRRANAARQASKHPPQPVLRGA